MSNKEPISITFFIQEKNGKTEVTSYINENITGIGNTVDEAIEDYSKKFNVWSNMIADEAKKTITEKYPNYKYSEKKIILKMNV